jgi:signal transduction histidine kinase
MTARGFPKADREKVFNPFVRLETSRNRDTGGVGPGLSIARCIFRGHGGDITLSGKGPGLRVHCVSQPLVNSKPCVESVDARRVEVRPGNAAFPIPDQAL